MNENHFTQGLPEFFDRTLYAASLATYLMTLEETFDAEQYDIIRIPGLELNRYFSARDDHSFSPATVRAFAHLVELLPEVARQLAPEGTKMVRQDTQALISKLDRTSKLSLPEIAVVLRDYITPCFAEAVQRLCAQNPEAAAQLSTEFIHRARVTPLPARRTGTPHKRVAMAADSGEFEIG